MKIAFFDFDGTITTNDSLFAFIRYACGNSRATWGMLRLAPLILAYKLKILSNHEAKQRMLTYFFGGLDKSEFEQTAENFSLNLIDAMLRPKAMEKIAWHKAQNHDIVVVTASMESWVKPWCEKNGLGLIATKLEVIDEKITGRFSTNNCYGPEKVERINDAYNLNNYDYIYAYGDSEGDKELLAMADSKNFRVF